MPPLWSELMRVADLVHPLAKLLAWWAGKIKISAVALEHAAELGRQITELIRENEPGTSGSTE